MQTWSSVLRDRAPVDELASYVWLAFSCTNGDARTLTLDAIVEPTSTFSSAPLIAFRRATCRTVSAEALQAILTRDPRFVEVQFYLGRRRRRPAGLGAGQARGRGTGIRRRVCVASGLAGADAGDREPRDDARGVRPRGRLLRPHPLDRAALRGCAARQGASADLSRPQLDAIATVDQLMAERWFLGDAHFWRALNLYELERYDEAWTDIEAAAKLLVNAEVPKLAGRIAYSRHQLEVSHAKFEESAPTQTGRLRNRLLPRRGSRRTARTGRVPRRSCIDTADCLTMPSTATKRTSRRLRASSEPPERKAIENRGDGSSTSPAGGGRWRRPGSTPRLRITTCPAARTLGQYAAKVADDEQFGERARELLSRLGK